VPFDAVTLPPDEQPTLVDGELVLRPWRAEDADATRPLHDAVMARWFHSPAVVPDRDDHLAWVERTHAEWREGSKATFVLQWRGEAVGSVDVRHRSPGVGALSWAVFAPYRGRGLSSTAVRRLVRWCFTAADAPEPGLGLRRVEAKVNPLNRSSMNTALRSGLRREGVLRGNTLLGDEVHDTVLLGRLATDPEPGTREGFTAMLDSQLPTKRVIGQGLVRNGAGELLLCELAYKREWDLPGGVVDPGESPATCVVREIREELALDVSVTRLLAVNWLKPWLGWGDAVLFVFEVAPIGDDLTDRATLLEREVRALHWVSPTDAPEHVAPYNARMLASLGAAEAAGDTGTLVLEDGLPRREGA
jgi:RimJ/RimL family protein N-acetyltransferase/8-oxo-dGTP pyrophosphatase MutT (NUDIX family)